MKKMYSFFAPLLALLLALGPTEGPGSGDRRFVQEAQAEHGAWSALLSQYVDEQGLVDYRGFIKDSSALEKYLMQLAENVPQEGAGRNEKLAYYINLYNAATVKLILDHYPVKSIKDIKNPWDREWVQVGKSKLSLGQIEHDILRKMGEPRIHFAINCASYSCPKLWNRAYTATGLDQQLELATREFIRDPALNRISGEAVELSMIFRWYKGDFTEGGPLLSYITTYSDVRPDPGARISYKDYNWSLNEAR